MSAYDFSHVRLSAPFRKENIKENVLACFYANKTTNSKTEISTESLFQLLESRL
jgi:hypothetical protein